MAQRTVLLPSRLLTPEDWGRTGLVLGEAGITGLLFTDPPPDARVVDSTGFTLAPGFIDLHVHGGGGHSLTTDDPDEVRAYARWVTRHGVTAFAPTIIGGAPERTMRMLRAASSAVGRVQGGAEVVGVHLEGPFINPARAGAFRKHWIHAFDPDQFLEYTRVSANTRLQVTLATELLGSTRIMCGSNVILALGHTDATYAEAVDAFERGISHCTHLFNAMRPFHHREPGVLGAALTTPQVTAELIADGVHVADGALKTAYVCMGSRRLCLVTDGIPLAGMGDGEFELGDERVRCRNGRATLSDGTLAGSVTTMDECVRRMARIAGTLPEALRMAAGAPAKVWGLSKKGRLLPGYEADIVALRDDQTVAMTWAGGKLVWDGRTVEERARTG